jgi:SAM-dependent MidA family methyltransferase
MGGTALENHISAHKRLTHPDEMGSLFKAIAIIPENSDLPAGFNE